MTRTRYIVAPAPGYSGDQTIVLSSHRTLAAARKAAGKRWAIYEGHEKKGTEWLRAYAHGRQRYQ